MGLNPKHWCELTERRKDIPEPIENEHANSYLEAKS